MAGVQFSIIIVIKSSSPSIYPDGKADRTRPVGATLGGPWTNERAINPIALCQDTLILSTKVIAPVIYFYLSVSTYIKTK